MDPGADGTAQREAYRRFIMASVQPMADLMAEVAGEALDTRRSPSQFAALHAHDIAGRIARRIVQAQSDGRECRLEEAQKAGRVHRLNRLNRGYPYPSGGSSSSILGRSYGPGSGHSRPLCPLSRVSCALGVTMPYPMRVCARTSDGKVMDVHLHI